jgi:hypothetical protein
MPDRGKRIHPSVRNLPGRVDKAGLGNSIDLMQKEE